MEAPQAQRPRSVRSVASNSSLGSTVSLARRQRTSTRARSRTVTGSSVPPSDDPPPALPYAPGPLIQEPLEDDLSATPESPHHLGLPVETLRGSDTTSSRGIEGSTFVVEPTQSTAISAAAHPPALSKASKQASSLPHLDTTPRYKPPPSAFSRDPALTPGKNVRDSLSTEQSGMSSSLYPPSTSSASMPASPLSPMALQIDPPSFALEVNEVQEYDGDDVAYRLRLLVQNSYFLPPAHSKPSPADFAPTPQQQQKKSPRTNAPAFLDIFRVGKSKSKPTTPTGTGNMLDNLAPMLRTTGDSITPAFAPADQPRVSPGQPPLRSSAPQAPPPARGRVVVVREKMADIATAAKQAEQEVKARGAVRASHSGSQHDNNHATLDDSVDIDPTDAVDVPPPPPAYPFAVQASALRGLGVADSVGAGELLAGLLPASENPTLARSYDAAEDAWRKRLLHQAVGHSLDNTPDSSVEVSRSMEMSASMDISMFSQPLSGAVSPVTVPKASASLDVERKGSVGANSAQAQAQTRQAPTQHQSQSQAHLIARKITDALPLIETPLGAPRTMSPGAHSNNNGPNHSHCNINHPALPRKSGESHVSTSSRISMKRNLGLPLALAEMLTLSMPRPGSTLPPRAETPVAPQTPLGPPPRRATQSGKLSSSASPVAGPGSSPGGSDPTPVFEWGGAVDQQQQHAVLRRTVSTPSLAEGYDAAVARRASTPPPLPMTMDVTITAAGARTATYRLSQATVTSFNTLDNDNDARHSQFGSGSGMHTSEMGGSRRSVSGPHASESDYGYDDSYEQNPGRVSLALSAFPAPSTRSRTRSQSQHGSRSRSRNGSGSWGRSRPSLSQSEYSQASLSPTTSAFQEMLNHRPSSSSAPASAPPSAAPTPEPGASSRFAGQEPHRYATYIDAARLEAMSPPPRNSSSLAFEALPAPPRSASLVYGNRNSNSNLSNGTSSRDFNSKSTSNTGSRLKLNLHSSYIPPPRPGTAPASPGFTHGGRSSSQPPVHRYPASVSMPSVFTMSTPPATTTTPTSATLGQYILGPAPLAITLEILAPEPTTPPLPPNTSFGDDAVIPALSGTGAGRGMAGVPSFFDSIQSHMDDMESSSEEEDEEDGEDEDDLSVGMPLSNGRHYPHPPPRSFSADSPGRPRTVSVAADTPPRRPMMKHANFSVPYIRSSAGEGQSQGQSNRSDSGHSASGHGHGHISSKHAVSNVAVKPLQPGLAASSDFFRYAQEHPAGASGVGSSSAAAVGAMVRGSTPNLNFKAQESLRKFDGMLQQHIEAEKDTIKRIATTLKQQTASSSNGSGVDSLRDLNLPGRR